MRPSLLASLGLLALSSCYASRTPYEPLVCDPLRADEVAFGYQVSGGHLPFTPYGVSFLLIDGSCRFFVADASVHDDTLHRVVRTGVLTPGELAEIDAELMRAEWIEVDGERSGFGSPLIGPPTVSLWRGDVVASCHGTCSRASATLRALATSADRWAARLAARGEPMDGPVGVRVSRWGLDGSPGWEGATSLAAGLPPHRDEAGVVRVDDPADAARLRALRHAHEGWLLLHEGDVAFSASVFDWIPFADERGRLWPP